MTDEAQMFDLPVALPRIRSRRARAVARLFGLSRGGKSRRRCDALQDSLCQSLLPEPGRILLVTGPSGSGKSTLVRLLRTRLEPDFTVDLDALEIPDRPLVDLFPDLTIDESLAHLARFGLPEAWTYVRTPCELSAGQHWRLRLAMAPHRARAMHTATILCDEFTSLLDRITACIIARSLRRSIASPLRAIVATSHDDLARALQPDMIATCDFGRVTTEERGSSTHRNPADTAA